MDLKKYIIYNNDLKFRDNRKLNFNDIDITKNNIRHKININHDTIEYRLTECESHGFFILDFSQLKLIEFPKLSQKFITISCLFLEGNQIKGKLDVSTLKNLISIDIDNNEINELILPNYIEEISCQNNKLTKLDLYPNLKRLNICHNKFNSVQNYLKLEILEADDNLITELSEYQNLIRLIIFNNPLQKLTLNNKLKYVDLSETKIKQLNTSNNIEHLVANYCLELTELPDFNNLKSLELMGTKLNKLRFYKNFEIIIFQINLIEHISSKYKSTNANFQLRNNKMLCISKGDIEFNF